MRTLEASEIALLELMAIEPPAFLPPRILALAHEMCALGLAIHQEDFWYPTALGIARTGRTLH